MTIAYGKVQQLQCNPYRMMDLDLNIIEGKLRLRVCVCSIFGFCSFDRAENGQNIIVIHECGHNDVFACPSESENSDYRKPISETAGNVVYLTQMDRRGSSHSAKWCLLKVRLHTSHKVQCYNKEEYSGRY